MNTLRALTLACCALLAATAAADTFTDEARTLSDGEAATVRGVINSVSVPVADDLELGPVQNGFFLFTPNEFTINVKDEDGKPAKVEHQQLFHLTPSAEQVKELKKILGKPVELKVVPFTAHTRHHRTPALFEIKSFKVLGK